MQEEIQEMRAVEMKLEGKLAECNFDHKLIIYIIYSRIVQQK